MTRVLPHGAPFHGQARPRPPDSMPHVRPKPGGAERPPPVLLVKPDRTLDEVPDRRLDDREPVRAEMIAQEVEAPLDPPDEGLVRVVNFCSWLKADLQSPENEVCSTPRNGHFRGIG